MADKIEKKISRVVKWLERCTLACRSKSFGSALMDIECARVDFDSARDEIWNTVNEKHNPASRKIYFFKFFRTAITSAVILLSVAAPLSFLENTFPAIATSSSLEWVNSDEKALLMNLWEQLSNANSGWISDLTDSPAVTYEESDSKTEINRAQRNSLQAKSETILADRNLGVERSLNNKSDIINEAQIYTLLRIG
jgi:hypothetical protein